jgi:serine O-acetyltransferase
MVDTNTRIWKAMRREVKEMADREPILASFLYSAVLNHPSFEEALSFLLASKLASATIHSITLRDVMYKAHQEDPTIADACVADLVAVKDRDPACRGYAHPFLYFKGYHSLQTYRVAHHLWNNGRQELALHLQSRMSEIFAVDIHPAARIGCGILMDHGTGVVIGETAVVEDNVSILHEVTLGGTGKQGGDRHPKIRKGCLISVGAKILGNIEIGEGAKVGGGAVVLTDVAPHMTVAGIPARPVGKVKGAPSKDMDQMFTDGQTFYDGNGI